MESSIFASICLLFLRFWLIETGFDWLHSSYVAQVGLLTLLTVHLPQPDGCWDYPQLHSNLAPFTFICLREMESLSPGRHHTYSVADDDLKLLCVFPPSC